MYDWKESNNRAIMIIRRSGRGQEDNTSATTQRDGINTYSNHLELEVINSFDIIESAKDSEKRKEFKKIDAWAKKHKIRHRIYYKIDREARNLTDNERGETEIKKTLYVLHYVLENKVFHKNTPYNYNLGSEFYISKGEDFKFFKNKQNFAIIREHNKLIEKEIQAKDNILTNEDLMLINDKTKHIEDA